MVSKGGIFRGHGRPSPEQRPRKSNMAWEKWRGTLAPELEGQLTQAVRGTAHPSPTWP